MELLDTKFFSITSSDLCSTDCRENTDKEPLLSILFSLKLPIEEDLESIDEDLTLLQISIFSAFSSLE